jgi:hypothetical protein
VQNAGQFCDDSGRHAELLWQGQVISITSALDLLVMTMVLSMFSTLVMLMTLPGLLSSCFGLFNHHYPSLAAAVTVAAIVAAAPWQQTE